MRYYAIAGFGCQAKRGIDPSYCLTQGCYRSVVR